MAIKVSNGFDVRSKNPIDTRIILSKAEMVLINDKLMPEKYFALCTDDNKLYVYDKSIEPNAFTGKFRLADKETLEALEQLKDDVEQVKTDVDILDKNTVKTKDALTEEEIKDITNE